MRDPKQQPRPGPDAVPAAEAEPRPAYERPLLLKKRAVTRATLFSGGGPASLPPLIAQG